MFFNSNKPWKIIPSRSRCLESLPPGVPVEGSKIITTMILEPLTAMILEPWKFGYMSVVVLWIDSNRPQERSLFWSAEKGTKSWWGLCTKVQNMFGINIPRFGRSRFPFSKPGGFNVAWFEISEKRSSNGVEQLQQCAMINKVLIYIRQHPQLKKHASPLPSTSHTMPMLLGKCKCQAKLWWATCSDAPPCFHPTPPFFRC